MVFTPGKKKFIELLDTPNSYAGFADYFVKVKSTEDGLEFAEMAAAGGGIPYRIVAASDASDESKQKAHYICDGTHDEVEIQQAIDDLPSQGGIIFLTEGKFNLADYLQAGKNLIFIGSGPLMTNVSYTQTIFDKENIPLIVFRDLQLYASTTGAGLYFFNHCGGTRWIFDSCYFGGKRTTISVNSTYGGNPTLYVFNSWGYFGDFAGTSDTYRLSRLFITNSDLASFLYLSANNYIFISNSNLEFYNTSFGLLSNRISSNIKSIIVVNSRLYNGKIETRSFSDNRYIISNNIIDSCEVTINSGASFYNNIIKNSTVTINGGIVGSIL